jgi:mitochondrial import inner membrane translocase subunit TIM21
VEDPFDAPTYHIPEKPVTFTEGASYSLIILAGLGIAGIAAYGVFKELIFEPKEYANSFHFLNILSQLRKQER